MQEVMEQASFVGDPGNKFVATFERDFAKYIGVEHCLGVGNGTDSIEILLRAYGIGAGHEVLVPAMTWISTASAVVAVGAKPVFVDIDPEYYTIDETLIETSITPQTKAIIPVHLYGNMANMPAIMDIAAKHNLIVIEDCAQAHGAEIGGKKAGAWGHAASFSFYPGKNLGAYGDAGGITTNNEHIAATCRMIANHGQETKHQHRLIGRNSKLDGIQAAILSVKLNYLDSWTVARIAHAEYYNNLLGQSGTTLPVARPGSKHVYHLYVVQSLNRDSLVSLLNHNGIITGLHYPVSLPYLEVFKPYCPNPNFPVARSFQEKIVSLPMFAELEQSQIEQVASIVKQHAATNLATL